MQSTAEHKKKWYSGGRWAWVFGIAGITIIAFVAATGGKYFSWLLWIAIPYLMISLGYAFLIHAIPVFLSYGEEVDRRAEETREDKKD